MSFIRTNSGLRNLRLFKGVSYIVFTEGGITQFTAEQAFAGSCNEKTLDAPFWGVIINHFRPELDVAVKPVGSKTALLAILERIEEDEIPNIFVAADRDFEGQLSKERTSKFYICTLGYSWENCVHTRDNFIALASSLLVHDPHKRRAIIKSAEKAWLVFKRTAERLARVDSAAIRDVGSGLFDRNKDGKDMFVGNSSQVSFLDVKRRTTKLRAIKSKPTLQRVAAARNPWRFCYGKFIAAFARRLFRELFDSKYSDEVIDQMLLMAGRQMLLAGQKKSSIRYYQRKIDSILPAVK